jgi:hypothetical protein
MTDGPDTDRTDAQLLKDLRRNVKNADTVGETLLSGHFHAVRTTSTMLNKVAAIIRRHGDNLSVEVKKYNGKPDRSRMGGDVVAVLTYSPTPFMTGDVYRQTITRKISYNLA